MFSREKLEAVRTVVVHDNCPDGMASAILLHDALPKAEVRFVQYGTEAQKTLTPEPGMLFCDISPHVETYKSFVEAGAIVLDHHKTAKDVVLAFGDNGAFGDEATEPGVCGAVLAFRHVWTPILGLPFSQDCENAKRFAILAGVRDTWQKSDPLWHQACTQAEVLRFFPKEHWLKLARPFSPHNEDLWRERMTLGELLMEKHEESVKKTIQLGYRFTTNRGTRVIMFANTKATSDAAEMLGSEVDLTIGFNYLCDEAPATLVDCPLKDIHQEKYPSARLEDDGTFYCLGCKNRGKLSDYPQIRTTKQIPKMIFSTRGRNGFDCSRLAKQFGGGGHTAAAGFNVEISTSDLNPYMFVESLLNIYECLPQQ